MNSDLNLSNQRRTRITLAIFAVASWPQFFVPTVKWITFVRAIPGQAVVHRMAQANFNIRGWQGR
jgi:hypothetical protein